MAEVTPDAGRWTLDAGHQQRADDYRHDYLRPGLTEGKPAVTIIKRTEVIVGVE